MFKYMVSGIVLLLGCGESINNRLPEYKDSFNPGLTSMYNELIHRPSSENRILGITHYHLTAETTDFLDSMYNKIQYLPCQNDDRDCAYNLLTSINGIMLRSYIATSWNNFNARCYDRADSLFLDRTMTKFAHASSDTCWVKTTFLKLNKG